MKLFRHILILSLLFLLPIACGNNDEEAINTTDAILYISEGLDFTPLELVLPAGANITILNRHSSPHSVTSQSAPDTFDNTGDFDVLIPSDGVNYLTVPDAPSGTIFYYYRRFLNFEFDIG